MIAAFYVDGTFHGARSCREVTRTVRKGVEGENIKTWWEILCGESLVGSSFVPCALITCPDCREVLFGSN